MDGIQQVQNQNPITPTPPISTYPTHKPAPTSKTPWLLISLIFLLVGVSSYFGYQNYQLKQQLNVQQSTTSRATTAVTSPDPTTFPTSKTDFTTNSKTYKNSKYRITFDYPDDYTVEYETTRNDGSFLYEIRSPLDPNYDPEMRGAAGLGENELAINFIFADNSSSIKIDDYLTNFKKTTLEDGYSKIANTESINLNDQKVYILTIERPQSPIKKTALILSSSTLVEVTMEPVGSNRESEFSKILASFKFTN